MYEACAMRSAERWGDPRVEHNILCTILVQQPMETQQGRRRRRLIDGICALGTSIISLLDVDTCDIASDSPDVMFW